MLQNLESPVRIVVIDRLELVRAGIILILAQEPGFAVVGEGADWRDALTLAESKQPDIMLLGTEAHDGNGLDFLSGIFESCETIQVLMLTDSEDPEVHRSAIHRGAVGVVSKNVSADTLMKAIERVHAGEAWLDRSTTASILKQLSPRNRSQEPHPEKVKVDSLTKREREVIMLVGEGLKNIQIAERLFISSTTVHHHLTSIYSKLEVSDRLELLIYAYRNGLAALPR